MLSSKRTLSSLAVLGTALILAGCSGVETKAEYPTRNQDGSLNPDGKRPSIFGDEGLSLFGSNDTKDEAAQNVGIGVNAYLWRATLDTVSFMPLSSADPFGGTILTDWYSPPETPDERFKVNVYITDRRLRADAVHVAVFRQKLDAIGNWRDAATDNKTSMDLENTILTRARQLRIEADAKK